MLIRMLRRLILFVVLVRFLITLGVCLVCRIIGRFSTLWGNRLRMGRLLRLVNGRLTLTLMVVLRLIVILRVFVLIVVTIVCVVISVRIVLSSRI